MVRVPSGRSTLVNGNPAGIVAFVSGAVVDPALDVREAAFQRRDPVARQAAVGLLFGLAGAQDLVLIEARADGLSDLGKQRKFLARQFYVFAAAKNARDVARFTDARVRCIAARRELLRA